MKPTRAQIKLLKEHHLPTRRPTTVGEVICEEFLTPLNLTQTDLARALKMPRQTLSQIIHGRRSISPLTAIKLSRCLGCSTGFWLEIQQDVDLYDTIVATNLNNLKSVKKVT